MAACRASTLALTQGLTEDEYFRQAHPDLSPIGWHLGHIAFTEALWILEHLAGQNNPLVRHRQLFAADGLPKAAREQVPDLPTTLNYLALVREQVVTYLEQAPLPDQHRLWWWLLQHESQHAETISIVLALHRLRQGYYLLSQRPTVTGSQGGETLALSSHPAQGAMVFMPGIKIVAGYDGLDAMDNEQPLIETQVAPFHIDAYPVTVREFRAFIKAGGYHTPSLWSSQGWAWRSTAHVEHPLYWSDDSALEHHPVCGVSCYEAEAYATFMGKRLPTELEWERAALWTSSGEKLDLYPWGKRWPDASRGNFGGQWGTTLPVGNFPAGTPPGGCHDLLGNVWEWTASWFDGYPGFRAFPYGGYSAAYFDRQHRVLRGGSWATRPWALRGTLRNWYHPHVRQIFAGFRCAQDAG